MRSSKTNTLLIKTPEGIVFALLLAGPVTRFLAWVVDVVHACEWLQTRQRDELPGGRATPPLWSPRPAGKLRPRADQGRGETSS